jgi:hypothetical protein
MAPGNEFDWVVVERMRRVDRAIAELHDACADLGHEDAADRARRNWDEVVLADVELGRISDDAMRAYRMGRGSAAA